MSNIFNHSEDNTCLRLEENHTVHWLLGLVPSHIHVSDTIREYLARLLPLFLENFPALRNGLLLDTWSRLGQLFACSRNAVVGFKQVSLLWSVGANIWNWKLWSGCCCVCLEKQRKHLGKRGERCRLWAERSNKGSCLTLERERQRKAFLVPDRFTFSYRFSYSFAPIVSITGC